MSGAQSISTRRAYGVQRVCRVWHRARSSVYARRQATRSPAPCRRRGPIGAAPDDVLVAHIRRVLEASPFHGEGYRKAWAKLRVDGIRTSQERVRRLMRESGLQAPPRAGHAHGPKAHDGTITTEAPDVMWGTDMTATVTVAEGAAFVFSGAVTASEAIELVLNAQIALRNNRRLQAAMRSSRLPAVKTLAQFDFTFQPSIKREQIESLHELGCLDRAENVILLGPPGVGKTHLAISLAIAAAEAGRRVYYGTLAGLIDSLMDARAAGELSRRLRVLTHPALLVVDEIGDLPVSQDGAVLFFQLLNARHERASTVLTSNKGFEEWGHVLGDEIMAAALIDRLLHHCHIVNIRGNSYRMREHQHWLRTASDERREGVAS